MKKLIVFLILASSLFLTSINFAADTKLADLTKLAQGNDDLIMYCVTDPNGSPLDRYIPWEELILPWVGTTNLTTLGTIATGVWNAGAVTSSGLGTFNAGGYFLNGATDDGFIRIYEDTDDGGNYTHIKTVAQAGDITLTLPPDDGDAGEQLQTNGSGVLTWESAGSAAALDKAKMLRNAAQAINTGSFTKIAFDAEEYDVGGIGDFTTNDRVDIGTTGYYLVTATWTVNWIDNGEYLGIDIKVDGSTVNWVLITASTTGSNVWDSVTATDTHYLTSGQYVEMYVYHSEGSTENTDTGAGKKPRMSVVQLQ